MRPTFALIVLLTISSTALVSVEAFAAKNKTTGIDCRSGRYTKDENPDYVDRQYAENDEDGVSQTFGLGVGDTHELAIRFESGDRQTVKTELYRKSNPSVILERKNVDITDKCDEQTELGYAEEVLEFLDGGVSTENGALTYSCSATCALPTRPDGNR